MIDYTKILLIEVDTKRLLNRLEFKTEVSEKTGELSTKKVTIYHFCKVTVYGSGVTLFTGSIHKLYNSLKEIKAPNHKRIKQYKGFNGNQFTLNNILEVRKHLQNLFDCTPQQMAFQNIELGVNNTLLFNPKLYLKGLLYHKGILFEYKYQNNLAQAPHQRFIFKIYNKSEQYEMNKYVLRVELKIIKTEELKEIGLTTFTDVNIHTFDKVKEMLLKRFDEVMHYDYTINKKSLTNKEKQLSNNYSNPRYWINDLQPNLRYRHKKRLLKITEKYSDNLHQKIRQEIITECSMINRLSENPKCSIINSSSIGLITPHPHLKKPIKKCAITGVDISMQKKDSILLSHTGLKYYFKTDKKIFDEVKRKYLSDKWANSDYTTQIKEIAHNIRNTNSNRNIKQKRLYPNNQKQLFEISL
ncbi:MAG: hypothetical protein L3J20_10495 [Flavobacteriaceae bacterium]|nr:hypothetical protein [Flavobacteriaceae bacterium]